VNPAETASIVFVCVFSGTLVGMSLRVAIQEHRDTAAKIMLLDRMFGYYGP